MLRKRRRLNAQTELKRFHFTHHIKIHFLGLFLCFSKTFVFWGVLRLEQLLYKPHLTSIVVNGLVCLDLEYILQPILSSKFFVDMEAEHRGARPSKKNRNPYF